MCWENMSEEERNAYIAKRIKSGDLEVIYSRPGPNGLYYVTLRMPVDKAVTLQSLLTDLPFKDGLPELKVR